jgi:tRNA(Ile)-lysidine synthase
MLGNIGRYMSGLLPDKDQGLLLLAVSGGIDSMCMAAIMAQLGYRYEVAHCNFGLRGQESDADQRLVEDKLPQAEAVHTISFSTQLYAAQKGISIEMAARELRYQWFDKLFASGRYTCLCTAHNMNDNAETVLLNMIRGTGSRGMCGIPAERGYIARPMLGCSRADIEAYAAENNVPYRTDSTNLESLYTRNKIRNIIIPVIEEINPAFIATMNANISRWAYADKCRADAAELVRSKVFAQRGIAQVLNPQYIGSEIHSSFLLYDLLSPYNFSFEAACDIFSKPFRERGRKFVSATHQLEWGNEGIIISRIADNKPAAPPAICSPCAETEWYSCRLVPAASADFSLPLCVYLDADKLSYPLVFNNWEPGQRARLYGMGGRSKKISDILADYKLSKEQKGNKLVLLCGEEPVWVAGNRACHAYALSDITVNALEIKFKKEF